MYRNLMVIFGLVLIATTVDIILNIILFLLYFSVDVNGKEKKAKTKKDYGNRMNASDWKAVQKEMKQNNFSCQQPKMDRMNQEQMQMLQEQILRDQQQMKQQMELLIQQQKELQAHPQIEA